MDYATVNEAAATRNAPAFENVNTSEGLRLARYYALEEASVLAFGVLTVAWVVLSLLALAF